MLLSKQQQGGGSACHGLMGGARGGAQSITRRAVVCGCGQRELQNFSNMTEQSKDTDDLKEKHKNPLINYFLFMNDLSKVSVATQTSRDPGRLPSILTDACQHDAFTSTQVAQRLSHTHSIPACRTHHHRHDEHVTPEWWCGAWQAWAAAARHHSPSPATNPI